MRCLRGACCKSFRADMTGPFPDDVRYTALYSAPTACRLEVPPDPGPTG